MEKILLNGHSLNESIAMVKNAMTKEEDTRFIVRCKNCSLSIAATKLRNNGVLEVGLRNENDTDWMPLTMCEGTDSKFVLDRPIISNLPVMLLPAMITQFENMDRGDFAVVWDAYDTLATV